MTLETAVERLANIRRLKGQLQRDARLMNRPQNVIDELLADETALSMAIQIIRKEQQRRGMVRNITV